MGKSGIPLALDARDRRFESCHSDQTIMKKLLIHLISAALVVPIVLIGFYYYSKPADNTEVISCFNIPKDVIMKSYSAEEQEETPLHQLNCGLSLVSPKAKSYALEVEATAIEGAFPYWDVYYARCVLRCDLGHDTIFEHAAYWKGERYLIVCKDHLKE